MKIKYLIATNLLIWLFSANCFAQYYDEALLKKAEQGNVAALMELASESNGETEALNWYEKAANQNNVQAMIECGNLLCNKWNWDLEPDFFKGIAWYRKAAAKGSAEAKKKLADLDFSPSEDSHECPFYWMPCVDDLDNYKEIKANEATIKKEFAVNNPMATYYMAVLAYGDEDYDKAVKYLTDIYPIVMDEDNSFDDFLEEDDPYSLSSAFLLPVRVFSLLGLCYEFGLGVKQDLHKAAEYYLSDFDYFDFGQLTSPKIRAAFCYLQAEDYAKFIEQLNSQYIVWGNNPKKHYIPCLKLELAELYKTGKGVPSKDLSKALAIYEEIVDDRGQTMGGMGDFSEFRSFPDVARAAYRASKMYRNGEGCTKDEDMANLYFDIALKYGDNNAWYEHERK